MIAGNTERPDFLLRHLGLALPEVPFGGIKDSGLGYKEGVVEAMKMQYVVRAPRDLVVRAVKAEPGRPVDIGQVLVEFEAAVTPKDDPAVP